MERTKKIVEAPVEIVSTKLRWRKVGGGSLRLNLDGGNRIIKPGETFLADLEELPKAFMDTLECLDSEGLKTAVTSEKAKEAFVPVEYKLKKVKGTDLWNLLDAEGKALNEAPLTKEAAEELLNAVKA